MTAPRSVVCELGRGVPRLRLVREGTVAPSRAQIRAPGDVVQLLWPLLDHELVEVFYVVLLDVRSNVLGTVEVTRGILNSSLVHPREVFRLAIVGGAAGIIVVHNHPSGDPTPSVDDRAITRQLVEAGRLLDMPVYDHVILGAGRWVSFADLGLL